jgi:hypothetical protein
VAGDYRMRIYADIGNLHQFGSSVMGVLSQIKGAYRSAAVSPITSRPPISGMDTSRITTQIDAYNKTLIQSGQVFHRYVSGYTSDLARLDAAATKSGRGYGGIAFKTPYGPSVYGNIGQGRTAQAAAVGTRSFAKNFRPVMDELYTGSYKVQMGDLDRIMAAQKQLVPMARQIDALSKQAEVRAMGFNAKGMTFATAADQTKQQQAALTRSLAASQSMFGGAAAKYNKAGALTAPAFYQTGEPEFNKLLKTPYFTKLAGRTPESVLASEPLLKALAGSKMTLPPGVIGPVIPNKARDQLESLLAVSKPGVPLSDTKGVMKGILGISMGANVKGAPIPALQKAIPQARNISVIEKEIQETIKFLGKVEAALKKLEMTEKGYGKQLSTRIAAIKKGYSSQLKELQAAQTTPFVPRQLDQMLQKSKQFQKQFMRNMGITSPYGTADFAKQLQAKGITADVTKDFSRGIYRVGGEVKDLNGIVGQWSTLIDENGRVVEKWNGTMRNSGSFLRQTVTDFRKVVEWTIATTAVFGALGLAMQAFSKVNQMNADLQRFTITAKTTGEQTKQAFDTIADVAIRTATPLTELTGVMDDIALATRKSGQTTQEWISSMGNMSEAVGILTNITGMETVKATDLLSAAYKQLKIDTSDLIPLLSKVTAVGGGNAQAVEDIVTAVAALADAGRAAGLTVDQQIASVQILSQVTTKTAADTATAFKNLFGAINSPASEKRLKEFGINIRTATGGLKPFLEIYGEIYKAMQTGVIPEDRMQDVLRAISGGPRRAPDAAAFLNNYPKVMDAITIATNATNDALVANAQIMDTNQAKMQQMRTAFDVTLFESFTDSINKLVEVIYNLGMALNSVFGGIGGAAFSSITQIGLLMVGMTLLAKGGGGIIRSLRGIGKEFTQLGIIAKDTSSLGGMQKYLNTKIVNPATEKLPTIAGFRRYGTGVNQHYVPIKSSKLGDALTRPQSVALAQTQPGGYTPIINPRIGPKIPQPPLPPIQGYTIKKAGGREFYVPVIDTTPKVTPGLKGTGINVYGEQPIMVRKPGLTGGRQNITEALLKMVGSTSGRVGLGIGGGAALGLGLGAAGAATGNLQMATSVGQSLGILMATMGGPVGIAAGLSLAALSTGIQMLGEESDKAKEKMKANKTAAYELTKAIEGQVLAIQSAETAQTEAAAIMDRLSKTSKKTPEQDTKLVAAQKDYVKTTFDLIEARKILTDKEKELIDVLQQLGPEFETLISMLKAGVFTAEDRAKLTAKIEEEMLGQKGIPYFPNIEDYFKSSRSADTLAETRGLTQLPEGVYGRPNKKGEIPNLIPTKSLIDVITNMEPTKQWEQAFADIKSFSLGGTAPKGAGFVVTPEFVSAVYQAKLNASEEAQATAEFGEFVKLLGTFIQDFGALSPQTQTTFALEAYKAQTTVGAAKGTYKGQDLIDRQVRERIVEGLKDSFVEVTGTTAEKAIKQRNNEALKIQGESILTGKGKLTKEDAQAFYSVYAAANNLNQALSDPSSKLAADMMKLLVDTWTDGIGVIDGLTGGVEENRKAIQDETRTEEYLANLRSNYISGLKNYSQQLLDLNVQLQSGDITQSYYNKATSQTYALMDANRALFNQFKGMKDVALKGFATGLKDIIGLQGIQFETTESLITSLMGWMNTLNLAPSRIDAVRTAIINLATAANALNGLTANLNIDVNAALKGDPMAIFLAFMQLGPSKFFEFLKNMGQYNASINVLKNVAPQNYISTSSSGGTKGTTSNLDIPDEWKKYSQSSGISVKSMLLDAVAWAKKYQSSIPGANKEAKDDLVAVMDGNTRVLLQRGLKEEYLRKAIENQTEAIKKLTDELSKADMISRIRVGAGDFAAMANVPLNSKSGVSVGGPQGPVSVNLDINGQLLTPAQFDILANKIAAALKSQLTA